VTEADAATAIAATTTRRLQTALGHDTQRRALGSRIECRRHAPPLATNWKAVAGAPPAGSRRLGLEP